MENFILTREKSLLEMDVATLRADLQRKDEKIATLNEIIDSLSSQLERAKMEADQRIEEKDKNYQNIVNQVIEMQRGTIQKQKIMQVEVCSALMMHREKETVRNFTAHRMDYNSKLDWCRLLTKYIDEEAVMLFDIAWPVAVKTTYK
jgi:hypothetical protein